MRLRCFSKWIKTEGGDVVVVEEMMVRSGSVCVERFWKEGAPLVLGISWRMRAC